MFLLDAYDVFQDTPGCKTCDVWSSVSSAGADPFGTREVFVLLDSNYVENMMGLC